MNKARLTRKQQAEQTRQRLFDSAMSLFDKKGYDRVTVDEICAKAGVSKGAFYNHFNSKDQVVLETFMQADSYYEQVFPMLENEDTYLGKARVFAAAALANIEKTGVMVMRISYHGQIAPGVTSTPIASRDRALYRLAEQLAKAGQASGEVRTDIPSPMIAENIIHAIRGLVYDWCQQDGKFDLQEYGRFLMQMLTEGLLPRPGKLKS
jgi:TetR/AcrR family transcriptional regulator, fatty acid metabolism regulator protein